MPYIPKAKISYLNTNGNELVVMSNNNDYVGPYIKVNDGRYYAGWSNTNLGSELFLKTQEENGSILKQLIKSKNVVKFKLLKPQIENRLRNTQLPPVIKNTPTDNDYLSGFFTRYFSKRINSYSYLEISKDTYDAINRKESTYDYNLYVVGSLRWYITGVNVIKQNSLEIKKTQRKFPQVFYLFPVLNEFLQPSTDVIENLYTNGKELYYGDGTEYIGPYHVHPMQGPMEGATHELSPHPKLYYFNQLPQIGDNSYEDFLAGYNKIKCYKCITDENPDRSGRTEYYIYQSVEFIERSRLLGCPEGTFTDGVYGVPRGYDLAMEACPEPLGPPPPPDTNTEGTLGRPYTNNDDSTNVCGNEGDYSDFSPIPPFPGGGQIGGGFGGGSGGGGQGTGNTCFTPNTLITMADGTEKNISSVKVGEKVKSEIGESTILDIQIHEGNHEVYSINKSKPFVTEEHPFKTIDGWKAIDPFMTFEKHQILSNVLNLQDIVYKIDGKEVINSIEKGKITYKKVYNLSLDNEHVYYANGYLVHNDKGAGSDGALDGETWNGYEWVIGGVAGEQAALDG